MFCQPQGTVFPMCCACSKGAACNTVITTSCQSVSLTCAACSQGAASNVVSHDNTPQKEPHNSKRDPHKKLRLVNPSLYFLRVMCAVEVA